jgi:predicted transposase YbfD/YdcC
MGILDELRKEMQEIELESKHEGYWYSISNVLIVLVCGMLCGLQRIDDIHDWAKSSPTRKFLSEQFGMERVFCRAQFYNILKCIDANKFKLSFSRWMRSVLQSIKGKTVAIDGKTVCGTDKLTEDGSVLHIASALVSELKLVIGFTECKTKTGEITAFRELLELLDVAGAVVVADALHCNQNSARAVIEAKADYLFVVKDNVPALKADIELYIQNEDVPLHQTIEKNGGRIEKRTAYACTEIEWLDGKEKWENISCIGAIHREFEKKDQKSSEWHYYISSAPLSPETLLNHARLEWAVESMHWLLDVHFAEDKTRVWDMNVQKILNTTRKIALNLVRIFKDANYPNRVPLTSVLKENLFDLDMLAAFLGFFYHFSKLD